MATTHSTNPRIRALLGLFGWAALVFLAAAIGGAGSASAPEFYRALEQPGWAPPAWLFGPAWTLLYTLMAIAAWRVWLVRGFAGAAGALTLFGVQLVLNALWSWIFFVWQLGGIAVAEILVLWLLIVATVIAFWRIRALAGGLLLPYLVWVTYAAALTIDLWLRNPDML